MAPGVPEAAKWVEQTSIAAAVRESLWLFPAIETIHLLAMALLLITIAAVDLRLMGLAMRGTRVSAVIRQLLPWSWAAFGVQVLTGALLFSSEASRMVVNPAFQLKLVLLGLAGLNAAVFRWIACRDMPAWEVELGTPVRARIAGFLSLVLWTGVVAAGRWIGFI